jgi:hypothetical protein
MSTKLKGVGKFLDKEFYHNHQTNEVNTNE